MRQVVIGLIAVLVLAPAAPAQTVKGDPQAWEELKAALGRLAELRTYRTRFGPAPGLAPAGAEMSMVSEFVRPDRHRMVMRMEDMGMTEVVIVGREMRRRNTPLGRGAQLAQQQASLFNQAFGGGIGSIIGWITDPVGSAIGLVTSWVASRIATAAGAERPGLWKCTRLEESSPTSSTSSANRQSGGEITVTKLGEGTVEGARTVVYELAIPERGQTRKGRFHILADRGLPRRMEMADNSGKLMGMMDYYDFDAPITIELPPCEQ